jgi:hypothetical protein
MRVRALGVLMGVALALSGPGISVRGWEHIDTVSRSKCCLPVSVTVPTQPCLKYQRMVHGDCQEIREN